MTQHVPYIYIFLAVNILVFRYLNMSIYPEAGVRNQDSRKVLVILN